VSLRTLIETDRSVPLSQREPYDDRPWVALNMASSADGRATVGGKSGGLGNEADKQQFALLRSEVDCVLVGAATLAAEHYGSIIRDPAVREQRVAEGLRDQPLACIVTRSGRVPLDIPMFADPDQHVDVYTGGPVDAGGSQANVDVVRLDHPTFGDALRDLRTKHGARVVLCEGGPRVAGTLIAAGLLDEVFLTFSPLLVGGNGTKHITEGIELDPPTQLDLIRLREADGYLFLRYLVVHASRPS
jgi:riboflavin biosynthesis pyrimidine reductase